MKNGLEARGGLVSEVSERVKAREGVAVKLKGEWRVYVKESKFISLKLI